MQRNHSVPQQPEGVGFSVILIGFISLGVLLYGVHVLFFKGHALPQRRGQPPVTPVRETQQVTPAPDHTGDLASRSNRASRTVRDTNGPIEVRAVLNGTLQRPQ